MYKMHKKEALDLDIILDRKSVVPLYYQLKEQLYDKIKSGELPSGSLLPSETELCDTYGLSRGTVRQAINMLAEKGYVIRERGKGTCVRRPTLNHDLLGDYSFGLGIRKLGLKLKNIPLVVEVVPGKRRIADRLEIPQKADILHIARIRGAGDEPWIYEETYLESAAFPGLEESDFANELLSEILVERYHASMGRIAAYVEPTLINEKYAKLLNLEEKQAALVMDRVIFGENNKPLFYSYAVIRGDRCRYYFNVTR